MPNGDYHVLKGGEMKRKRKSARRKVARSAVSGRFVGKAYAKKHPRTTVIEIIKTTKKRIMKKMSGKAEKK